MARTIKEIYDNFISIKEGITNLDILDSNSDTAIWRNIFQSVAEGQKTLEDIMDNMTLELQKPDLQYWVKKIREFQHGDVLKFDIDKGYYYDVVDEAKQIVKYVSIGSSDIYQKLLIKVAKEGASGAEKLSVIELYYLQFYVKQIKILGSTMDVSSIDPDELYIEIKNVRIISDDTQADVTKKINDVLNGYLKDLDFNGIFNNSNVWDLLYGLDYIDNGFNVSEIKARKKGDTNWTNVINSYDSVAGYMRCNYDSVDANNNHFKITFI